MPIPEGFRPGSQPGDPLVEARAVLAVAVNGQHADSSLRGFGQQFR